MSPGSSPQRGSPCTSQSSPNSAEAGAISDPVFIDSLDTVRQSRAKDNIGCSERRDTVGNEDKRRSSPDRPESEPSKCSITISDKETRDNEIKSVAGVAPDKYGEGSDDAIEPATNASEPIQSLNTIFLKTARFLDIQQGEDVSGVQDLVREAESFNPEKNDLKRKKHAISKQLKVIQKRQRVAEDKVKEAEQSLQAERIAASISDDLWLEYQNFCAFPFLQPEPGAEPAVLNFTYNKEFEDSYIKYDPRFRAFKERGLLVKGENWRCNRTTLYSKGGTPFAYHVEFRQLPPGSLDGKTSWAERFPGLYALALHAAKVGSTAALEMLAALPYADDRRPSGHIFEFAYEEPHVPNPEQAGRWVFRTSYSLRTMYGVLWHYTSKKKQAEFVKKYELPFKVTDESESEGD